MSTKTGQLHRPAAEAPPEFLAPENCGRRPATGRKVSKGGLRVPRRAALFRVLVTGNRDPEAVYTAVREVESMAAVTTVAQLCAKIETVAERLGGEIREVNARLDSVNRQLRLMWTFLFALMAAVTTILLRI